MTYSRETSDELVHYGVKGMKWGVRNDQDGGYRVQASPLQIESGFHASTKQAVTEVSGLMSARYGYNIKNVKVLGPGHPEYPDTVAFVENNKNNHGRNEGTIFIQARDLSGPLKGAEKVGWMSPGTGNAKALLTHESAHSLFHADQKVKAGILTPKVVGGNIEARNKAMKAAAKAAKKDGISIWDVSGYAKTAGVREELEGELFSNYHWAEKPPRYVQVWGETLHRELGVDPMPFKEVKSA
jgi:hypothetical protein